MPDDIRVLRGLRQHALTRLEEGHTDARALLIAVEAMLAECEPQAPEG